MNKNTCKSCKYFVPHYVNFNGSFLEIEFGHCFFPRVKSRKADTPACQHFSEGEPQEILENGPVE
ncbi:MAG: hypothetical protein HFJ85_07170 [Oscillospiraceae bacterium]|nr:hypothetical protein [Oscillospiraceae bacterium]